MINSVNAPWTNGFQVATDALVPLLFLKATSAFQNG
jgi:hypothetical protein